MSRRRGRPLALVRQALDALGRRIRAEDARWVEGRLEQLPWHWRRRVGVEYAERAGVDTVAANRWLMSVTGPWRGRVGLAASDDDLREAAVEARRGAVDRVRAVMRVGGGLDVVRRALEGHCASWGVAPAEQAGEPGVRRMLDDRWYLRRLRRALGRRAEGAAVRAGVVRREVWPYASDDSVERRRHQRRRVARVMEAAVAVAADGEAVAMADVVAGSLANPECRRSELMVRIRGCDEYAESQGWQCEFWTLTTPSRFHAQSIKGDLLSGANTNYDGSSPREAQRWLSAQWAKARAAWARVGLRVAGLRTAEPHHDGTPHWHVIVYGPAADVRVARQLVRRYVLRDEGAEPGAWRHRFNFKIAEEGRGAAAYAAAYISKNINGAGMDGQGDDEAGGYISDAVKRVDAWASHWGIRQFQFFGMPRVGLWRTLRRVEPAELPRGAVLEAARAAADESDWCRFWKAAASGALEFIKGAERLTAYGDAARPAVVGVCEGGRRLLVKARDWVIYWGRAVKKSGGVVFDLPRSCVNNCTPSWDGVVEVWKGSAAARSLGGGRLRVDEGDAAWFGQVAALDGVP